MQQGAEHVDRAALEAFAADQHFGPFGGLIRAELPAPCGEVTQIQPPAPGVAAGGNHDHDLGDVGVVGADGGPGVFQGGDQAAGGGTVDRWRGGHEVAFGAASAALAAGGGRCARRRPGVGSGTGR
jgi:hypothetical protein